VPDWLNRGRYQGPLGASQAALLNQPAGSACLPDLGRDLGGTADRAAGTMLSRTRHLTQRSRCAAPVGSDSFFPLQPTRKFSKQMETDPSYSLCRSLPHEGTEGKREERLTSLTYPLTCGTPRRACVGLGEIWKAGHATVKKSCCCPRGRYVDANHNYNKPRRQAANSDRWGTSASIPCFDPVG
jgi:hypothetical protein